MSYEPRENAGNNDKQKETLSNTSLNKLKSNIIGRISNDLLQLCLINHALKSGRNLFPIFNEIRRVDPRDDHLHGNSDKKDTNIGDQISIKRNHTALHPSSFLFPNFWHFNDVILALAGSAIKIRSHV